MTRYLGYSSFIKSMNTTRYSGGKTMSFSLGTMACGIIPIEEGLADARVRQARMHPQSTGGPVLRLRSRRALSPVPQHQCEPTPSSGHAQISRSATANH
jgi:hypothetical protein